MMFLRLSHGIHEDVRDVIIDRRVVYFFLSIIYAAILTSLPLMEFRDREAYLAYANNSDLVLISYLGRGFVSFLFNEPVWLIVNAGLSWFLSPEVILRIFIFFPSLIVSYYALSRGKENLFWLLLILVLPVILKNHITHLRQGVAISVFLLFLMTNNKALKGLLICSTPFIHSSFFFIVVMYFGAELLKKIPFKRDLNTVIVGSSALALSFSLGYIVSLTGARQAERYAFEGSDGSGLNFLIWFVLLAVFLCQGSNHFKKFLFEYSVMIFYLASYFFVDVTARIFESAILLIFLSGFQLTSWRKNIYYLAIVFILFMQWYGRFTRSGLMF
jgi:hypothetical protein